MDGILRPILIIVLATAGFFVILALAINSSGGEGSLDGDWTVEAVVIEGEEFAPIDGTQLTASFSGGELNGSAGCNTYFGSYEAGGESLSIGPIASTERFCEDPNGVMDQEFAYLELLGEAESFSVSGDLLSIGVGEGRRIAYQRD